MINRIPVMDVQPTVEGGAYPVKAAIGERFDVRATVFREGHDALGANVVLTGPDGTDRSSVLMRSAADDGPPNRYLASVVADEVGDWTFRVESWSHPYATWEHDAQIKIAAGVDVELMLLEGALLLERAAEGRQQLLDAATALRDTGRPVEARLAAGCSAQVEQLLHEHPLRDLVQSTKPYPLQVDRARALTGSWYEFFPRSEGARHADDGSVIAGTLRTAADRLPAVAAMGFDVIYLPPVHPIGRVNRKGRNNTLDPGPDDVGSPWAIGSADGGHDAVAPELGTLAEFDAFVAAATDVGLEVAMDFALQCAPDHPWVEAHPEWFTTRADNTIAFAENPPKKYQDIYPLNFDNDYEGLYAEVLRVLRGWMDRGVRIFRVDNPHTKPVFFWQQLFAEVRHTDPDVIFLAEAFTKPAMMRTLGTIGFHQSYTYFTWRNEKWELEGYLHEVARETAHVLRPNFFVNTPDILPAYLQYGGPAAFTVRAALAATASPSWGVYAGFELFEHVAVRPGSEEYLDSEKYQVRVRDWAGAEADGRSLAPYLTKLNAIRRAHPALQQLRDLTIHRTDHDKIVCFSKRAQDAGGTDDVVIVVVNIDSHAMHDTWVHLDMPALGLDWQDTVTVHEEITDQTWHWGEHNWVQLAPWNEPVHILSLRNVGR